LPITNPLACASADTSASELYTLSLHDALPISSGCGQAEEKASAGVCGCAGLSPDLAPVQFDDAARYRQPCPCAFDLVLACPFGRSEEHTSELQSRENLVCRLLLEKKNSKHNMH